MLQVGDRTRKRAIIEMLAQQIKTVTISFQHLFARLVYRKKSFVLISWMSLFLVIWRKKIMWLYGIVVASHGPRIELYREDLRGVNVEVGYRAASASKHFFLYKRWDLYFIRWNYFLKYQFHLMEGTNHFKAIKLTMRPSQLIRNYFLKIEIMTNQLIRAIIYWSLAKQLQTAYIIFIRKVDFPKSMKWLATSKEG